MTFLRKSLEGIFSSLPQQHRVCFLFHFAIVMALTSGKADSRSSRSGFLIDKLLGEKTTHFSHLHKSCRAK